jgi:hypothetical protein
MTNSRKRIICSLAIIAAVAVGGTATGQDIGTTGSQASADVRVSPTLDSNVNASSGGNVFDFSSNGRNAPPGPNLPSFAGGPCMGVSGGVTASGPGFSLGAGRSFEDESCQRRNWVQTLVGVAQHMPQVEANELKRVAIALMMQDQYVGPAFESLGYDTTTGQPRRRQAAPEPTAMVQEVSQPPARSQDARRPVLAQMQQGCVTVIPANASASFRSLLEARGCTVQSR